MHKSSILRMTWFIENFIKYSHEKIKVLDVGSCDVNGSYRHLFDDRFIYTGLDVVEGANVDIVTNPYKWDLKTDYYDIVISGQAFEHIEFFWITMAEMTRVLKKGGLMCVIAPNGFKEHRHPVDCYRFFSDGMVALARWCKLQVLHASTNLAPSPDCKHWFSEHNADSMLIAEKNYSGIRFLDLENYKCIPVSLKYPLVEGKKTGIVKRIIRKIVLVK